MHTSSILGNSSLGVLQTFSQLSLRDNPYTHTVIAYLKLKELPRFIPIHSISPHMHHVNTFIYASADGDAHWGDPKLQDQWPLIGTFTIFMLLVPYIIG